MVPNGWVVLKLEDLEGGDRPVVKAGPFGSSLKKEFYTESGYKIYGQEQVIAGDAFIGDYYIDYEKYSSLKSCAVEPGDILISLVGTIGKVLLIPDNAQPGIINPRLLRISLNKDQMSSVFFKYFLESQPTVNRLTSLAQGGTMGVLNAATLKSLKIPVPPLPEQQKIAKILTTWDKAIDTTERLIDNSKQQKKALMQQLLTGKKRLFDDNGKPFEGEWEKVKLSDIANISMGSSPKSAAYNDEGIGLPLLQGNADIKNRKSAPRIYTSQITRECQIGDILLSVRAPVGTVALSEHHACIGRGISSIRAKKKHSQDFLYQLMLDFEPRWRAFSQGSTFEAVNSNDIKSLSLNVPNFEEQQKIAAVLTNADKEIELLEQQLADLQQEKKALMQQLLTGKKRVVVDGEVV